MKTILGYEFYSGTDLAKMLGINPNKGCKLIKSGEIESTEVGGRSFRMVSKYQLKKYLRVKSDGMDVEQQMSEMYDRIELLKHRVNEINEFILKDVVPIPGKGK